MNGHGSHSLRLKRVGIDTYQEAVVYMHRDCHVCRSEGFAAQSRVLLRCNGVELIATLNVVESSIVSPGEAGLSESAWRKFGARDGELLEVEPMPLIESLARVRGKLYGERLSDADLRAIVEDIAAGRYADIQLAAFVSACAGGRLDREEIVGLTRAMIDSGDRLAWPRGEKIADKHCVGGLPGNRTTLIVVPILAAAGLTMPKTSSRAITSPAGTADTMETLAPVDLDLASIRRVVEREGGCIVWGGAVGLSPADDALIRVERPLDLDSGAQLVASVISKKVAAGSTHAIIDIPVGPTAKVRSPAAARALGETLEHVAARVGLLAKIIVTDGTQPVGRGIGPALEARDVLQVLRGERAAPADLRERALALAGALLEHLAAAPFDKGILRARQILDSGAAWRKFEAICEAQGGLRELPHAAHTRPWPAAYGGTVISIDNRSLARAGKLAGAPRDPGAGIDLHVRLGARIARGEPLFTLHADSPGELDYALAYVKAHPMLIHVERDS
ncbi:MAG: thymidine phosphorylase family protein [Proteobacteria bacterium]|nr:thymidine phosphorylase family protein [Pseudomonadota bacterium]